MWWIFGIIVLCYIIYNVNREHKEHVETYVKKYGGMLSKYNILIKYMLVGGCKIQKVTNDSVILGMPNMTWWLDYVGYNLEVRVKGYNPMFGNISKKWVFQGGYPQEKMIEEIENYLDWLMDEFNKV